LRTLCTAGADAPQCRLTGVDRDAASLPAQEDSEICTESFHVADLSDPTGLPFVADGSQDVVLAMNVLQYIEGELDQVAHVLREVKRVLSPRGLVCLVVWGDEKECPALSVPIVLTQGDVPQGSGPFRFSDPTGLMKLVSLVGFTEEETQLVSGEITVEFDSIGAYSDWACTALDGKCDRIALASTLRDYFAQQHPDRDVDKDEPVGLGAMFHLIILSRSG
jgi:SAM-dependent methyltransferase